MHEVRVMTKYDTSDVGGSEAVRTIEDSLIRKYEVATFLSVTERTIDDWMKNGAIPYFKIGRSVRFRLRDVIEHLERKNKVS